MVMRTTLAKLREATIAHTDAGAYFVLNGTSCKEAVVEGEMVKVRPSLCYIEIEGEMFTAMKRKGVKVGDKVDCRLSLDYADGAPSFTILSFGPRQR